MRESRPQNPDRLVPLSEVSGVCSSSRSAAPLGARQVSLSKLPRRSGPVAPMPIFRPAQ